jgi:hypothetical protein
MVEYLLLRQHISALALGHHQVSNCVSEETTQCNIHIAHIFQRDLVDNVTIDNFQKKLAYKIKIVSYIKLASFDNYQWSRYQRDLGWYELYAYYIVQSPLRHNLRPDDGPVQGPKHVVLVINTPPPY